ncbi:uncharacterized protein LOC116778384 [Danaus plexippus]|uniref:uncharacterized protein LOC116778384 n=1 Tax=Danaus plexippus TaxID=13037 RepID=UPI002AB263F5|nr:uncharacterized protein LOC116778384 [Danaus plexippus]
MFSSYIHITILFGLLFNAIHSYVLLQVRKTDNQSNVDALIHKAVPPKQFQKIANTARKQFKNYKQFKIKSDPNDKELESVIFAIKTNADVKRRHNGPEYAMVFDDLKKKFLDFFNLPDKNDIPNLRAKLQKYDIKPQLVNFRDGNGKPSLMYEVEAKSVLDTIKDTITSKKFNKIANKLAQKAGLILRTLNEELNKN